MSDGAWGALAAVFVALFGAGGFAQWRRTSANQRRLEPVAETAAEAKAGIETLLPIVQDLQKQLRDTEAREVELMIMLAAHGEWDQRVLKEIRKFDPEFPDPPPIKQLKRKEPDE